MRSLVYVLKDCLRAGLVIPSPELKMVLLCSLSTPRFRGRFSPDVTAGDVRACLRNCVVLVLSLAHMEPPALRVTL